MRLPFLLLLFAVGVPFIQADIRPNIVLFLTDDQDIFLDGMTPLTKTKKLLGEEGTTFENGFVTTPVCCPSRASLLTGKYLHNSGTFNNSVSGNCGGQSWIENGESNTFATALHAAGYRTMYAGKYMNQYGHRDAGGVEQVPVGWDVWNALVGNSIYYNYTLSMNGEPEKHGDNYEEDYLTDVIWRKADSFLGSWDKEAPFLMVLGTPASHAPFTPAPQYSQNYSDLVSPRIPSYNLPDTNSEKHWFMRFPPQELSEMARSEIDEVYRNRWRTLLSVDDLVGNTVHRVEQLGELENTYFVYMSDHGYHMGEFALSIDKRQPYEFDIRIPIIMRGPKIAKNVTSKVPALQIDIGPTFLEIAGLEAQDMDGMSLLNRNEEEREFLVEYSGEGGQGVHPDCSQWNTGDFSFCKPEFDCKCTDAKNNTYSCIRRLGEGLNTIYCMFEDDENFQEFYDIDQDPYQLSNDAYKRDVREDLELLVELSACHGSSCHKFNSRRTKLAGEYDAEHPLPVIEVV